MFWIALCGYECCVLVACVYLIGVVLDVVVLLVCFVCGFVLLILGLSLLV